jgi:hypothetical protein
MENNHLKKILISLSRFRLVVFLKVDFSKMKSCFFVISLCCEFGFTQALTVVGKIAFVEIIRGKRIVGPILRKVLDTRLIIIV